MAHKHPFDFEVADLDFRDDAFRFLNGTPAIPSLYANEPGIDIIARVGVENIRRKSMRQTALIIEHAQAAGYVINSVLDPEHRAGTVTLQPENAYAVSRELIARNTLVDYRPQAGIRVAPHFYNSDEEIHQAIDTIGEILADGSWQRHTSARTFVT
jgi:kynureninase